MKLDWISPGPVSDAFMDSREFVQGIMGPVGSGKTSTTMVKILTMAQEQAPSIIDGVRKFRVAWIRDTYRQLWKTTIPSWHEWMPKEAGNWKGGDGEPASHTIRIALLDDTVVELEVHFLAIGENKVEDVLRGYQVTAFVLEEADLLFPDVLLYCRSRVGRWPRKDDGGPTWRGVLMVYNAPDDENYLYELFEVDKPQGHVLFRQPSGLSPDAENLDNLDGGQDYYRRMCMGAKPWFIRRMVEAKYGYVQGVEPVYPEFNDLVNVAREPLKPVPGLPLYIGGDAGMTPSAIIRQRMPNGQVRWLKELVTAKGTTMGPTRFGQWLNRVLKEEFPEWNRDSIFCAADPSAQYGGDADDLAWLDTVRKVTGLRWRPAPSNAPTKRISAVDCHFGKFIDGDPNIPEFIISPTMVVTRKGFNSGYRWHVIDIPGGRYHNTGEVEKNFHSHPHDAGQYVELTFGENMDVDARRQEAAGGGRGRQAVK